MAAKKQLMKPATQKVVKDAKPTKRRCGISMQFGLWRTAPYRALVKPWVA